MEIQIVMVMCPLEQVMGHLLIPEIQQMEENLSGKGTLLIPPNQFHSISSDLVAFPIFVCFMST